MNEPEYTVFVFVSKALRNMFNCCLLSKNDP